MSMLRSLLRNQSSLDEDQLNRLDRFRVHEYEDHSDSEGAATSSKPKEFIEFSKSERRSASAGMRASFVRDTEARLTGLRHEKMNTQPSGTCRDDRLTGLIYDPDFDCYYNPMDDQYYKVQPSESEFR